MFIFKVNQTDVVDEESVKPDFSLTHQTIDGFGMNINPMLWEDGNIIPVLELFYHDLEATLYRLDVFGQSDWVDQQSQFDKSVLNEETYSRVYRSPAFRNTWSMVRHMNSNGIEPYLNASGVVPLWMCAEDGKTLRDYESFSEMMASMLHWARHKENLNFKLFGPLNETDLGPPEGPQLDPAGFAVCMEVLAGTLERWGLHDIKLVVAEQGLPTTDYMEHILASEALIGKIAVMGMHCYNETRFAHFPRLLDSYADKSTRFWMTEYGDGDATGEKEWEAAENSTRRLIHCLLDGAQAGLVWDAYDNFHDHDKAWSIYGLVRRSRHEYTPKKRYYAAKQIYKFVKPGSTRIELQGMSSELHAAAFRHPLHGTTIAGMNTRSRPIRLTIELDPSSGPLFQGYFTNRELNCADVGTFAAEGGTLKLLIPANTIFTLSQSRTKSRNPHK